MQFGKQRTTKTLDDEGSTDLTEDNLGDKYEQAKPEKK